MMRLSLVYNVCGCAEVGVDTDALPVADWWSCGRGDLTIDIGNPSTRNLIAIELGQSS